MGKFRESTIDDWFEQQLNKKESGCWDWSRCKSRKGYGQFRYNGKTTFTHRYVLEKKIGRPIQKGFMACHSCHNRACCNPEHIREGTAKENTQDMLVANRQATKEKTAHYGEAHGMCKLKTTDVIEIRNLRNIESVHQTAKRFGVSASCISSIQLRKTWKHI